VNFFWDWLSTFMQEDADATAEYVARKMRGEL
jgi:hypothetical protein